MKNVWGGMTRTEYAELRFLKKQEASLAAKFEKMKQTIEDRHLNDEAALNATVGAELARKREQIAALEAKQVPAQAEV
jgi:hypothetical protein